MEKTSMQKLQAAGYVFLRTGEVVGKKMVKSFIIKQSKEFGFWTTREKFPTKVARNRRLKELLEEPWFICESYEQSI